MPVSLNEQTEAHQLVESQRLAALEALDILDTAPEPCFDTIVRLAAMHMDQQTAYLAFLDQTRVWTKASLRAKIREAPRQNSNTERIVLEGTPLVLLDMELHPEMRDVAAIYRALDLRFFVGVPVRSPAGLVVGALCVCGSQPREQVSGSEIRLLEHLSELVTDELELRQLRSPSRLSHGGRAVSSSEARTASNVAEAGRIAPWPQPEDIRNGLKLHQFVLHYQPEVELETRRIVGMEALIRWQHPERGMVPPLDFIPQAEENGMILPIGDWGLGHACRQMQLWQRRWPALSSLRVCVNLSARQFSRPGLADHVESLLLETGLSGRQLGLEMTESSLNPNPVEAARVLVELQRLGVSLHLDDFGTGYSSLSHLHSFPFDTLKIDRSFVQRMHPGNQAFQIVHTILELARVLGMEVIAEGIETEEQSCMLQQAGCRYGQGYYFSRPLPAQQMERLLSYPIPTTSPTVGQSLPRLPASDSQAGLPAA